jgi:hypothetical protein
MSAASPSPQRYSPGDLDALRRNVSLVAMVSRRVKLTRAGRGWKGLCPFHQERTPSFTVNDEKGFYHCFGCGAHGDVIEWVVQTEGIGFREAVEKLGDGSLPASPRREIPQREADRQARHDVVGSATVGRHIWASAGPARGEIVENWLRARGLDPEGVPGALDRLRFHARCPVVPWRVHESAEDAWLTAPAMVAPISDEEGRVWGVHCTYLAPDGGAKARLPRTRDGKDRPTRKMWGRVAGLAVWLTDLRSPSTASRSPSPATAGEDLGPGPLIVGEGIETVWAYVQGAALPYRAAAALSLENLQGREIKLRDGSTPLWWPKSDPKRTMFTFPDPGDVVMLVDADMKPLKDQKVQIECGAKPVRADISGMQRAQLCAQLGGQAWRRAGATSFTAVRPRMGNDFNDELKALPPQAGADSRMRPGIAPPASDHLSTRPLEGDGE